MAPIDNSPSVCRSGTFKMLHCLKAYDKFPISEYISTKTGLTVVIAEVEGPVVSGYFCLATETYDDDGLPHTLEHLVFLGSEEYPYKGILDMLANRCLASGTNAWTDKDHTCYRMETAGSEGFLQLMPIYLEHILYPTLTEEAYVTEVHHITDKGEDSGVVYAEIQGRENSAETRLHVAVVRNIYPGKCGYSSDSGGTLRNFRESTNNDKVRLFHKKFYRPENLKVIITGQVEHQEVFQALEKLEENILSKGDRGPFARPWQTFVAPLSKSLELVINYPTDDETSGLFCMAWRGPSAVQDLYSMTACSLLLKYLTEHAASPLPKTFVQIEDPFASEVSYGLYENSETCLYISFEDVPMEKLPLIQKELQKTLQKIYNEKNIEMDCLTSIINQYKLECLTSIESSPHDAVAFMLIGHMLYGNSKADLQQRVNPLIDLENLLQEPQQFWLETFNKYFIENHYIAVQCLPSKKEKLKLQEDETKRIQKQTETLGPEGLAKKKDILEKSVAFNDRLPPTEMLTSLKVPSITNMKFHCLERFSSSTKSDKIDLTKTPVFTFFDHVQSHFVYMLALLDTSSLSQEQRLYLPLLLESLLELPLKKGDKIMHYEEVVAKLSDDTVARTTNLGLCLSSLPVFTCSSFSNTAMIMLQVEASKYEVGLEWLKDLLYNTIFTVERLKVIANKLNNMVGQAKRNERTIVSSAMKCLLYNKQSNVQNTSILKQNKFLTKILKEFENGDNSTIEMIEDVRKNLTQTSNLVLYLAGNLNAISNVETPLNQWVSSSNLDKISKLNALPDYKLFYDSCDLSGCIIGLGCLESSYFYQTTKSISSSEDPDLPALLLFLQYLIQTEGPMWKQIRGKGFSYGYTILLKLNEGLLYLVYSRATNLLGAHTETVNLLQNLLTSKTWDDNLLESARSSLIFEILEEEKTIKSTIFLSLKSYFENCDFTNNRKLLNQINSVTLEDLNRVGQLYVKPLLDSSQVKTAIIANPAKVQEIAKGMEMFGLKLRVYDSLEDSFLNEI